MWIPPGVRPGRYATGWSGGPGEGGPSSPDAAPLASHTVGLARYTGRWWAASGSSVLVASEIRGVTWTHASFVSSVTSRKTRGVPGRAVSDAPSMFVQALGTVTHVERAGAEAHQAPPRMCRARARTRGSEADLPTQHPKAG